MSRAASFILSLTGVRAQAWISILGPLIAVVTAHADPLSLKATRELAPPAVRSAPLRIGAPAQAQAQARAQAAEPPRGVVFLRADRLEGNEDKITAEGGVELRSRYETVLADWLSYDPTKDEIWAKGNVVIRRGYDWITGPELRYERDTPAGRVRRPAVLRCRGQRQRFGDGDPFRRAGQVRRDGRALHDVHRAESGLVPDERAARGRHAAQSRHGAPRERLFHGRPGDVLAVARVPAVERAQVGIPHAAVRLERRARPRGEHPVLLQPRPQLRRDAGATDHEQARPHDWRPVPLPVGRRRHAVLGTGCRRGQRRVRPRRSRDARVALRDFVAAQRTVHAVARRLRQREQGVRRYVLRGLCRPRRDHVTENPAARRGPGRLVRSVVAARARAGIPDAAGPEPAAGDAAVQPRAANSRNAGPDRLDGAHLERHDRVRGFPAGRAYADRQALRAVPARRLGAAGRRVVFHRARQRAILAVRSQSDGTSAREHTAERDGADREPRRGTRVRARGSIFDTDFVQTLEPRAFYVYIPFKNQSQLPVFDSALDDFSFSSLFTETVTSATTAWATPTSSRWR